MARRSLQASGIGIEKAKRAFKSKQWTQEYLASEVGIETRQPIWKFFTGRPVERQIFLEICFQLDLDWQEIAAGQTESLEKVKECERDNCWDIDALVQKARLARRDKIQAQCGTVRLLDTAQPIDIEDIYISADILESITSQRWVNISDLQSFNQLEFDRYGLGQIYQERVPAVQAITSHSKLMVLGKPGTGKTTFLQYIALKCNQGELLPDRVPIFIRLKNFAEDASESGNFSLLSHLLQDLVKSDISEQQVETLLHHGKALILLDGLDELQEEDRSEILKQIRKLSQEYYKNQFVITCRIAAQQYQFEEFTDIEIADFDFSQIEAFAQKWFISVGKNAKKVGLVKATRFMQKLQLSENRQIRELARTPLLLHLACSVFQAMSDFPAKRSDLYKQALEILLVRWDKARGIKRDEIYHELSVPHKLKLLSQIAAITFEQGHYFFPQSHVQQYIIEYLRSLPNAQTAPEQLQLNSEIVLKSIEAQHGLLVERARGIYSFSHLTFQEYLTARNFVSSFEPQVLNKNLVQLASHTTKPCWREVILLTAGMLENADALIHFMRQYSNRLMATDEKLQQFLVWLEEKSLSVQASYKSAAIRAFYLTLVLPGELTLVRDLSLALAIDLGLAGNLAPDLTLDLALHRALSLSLALSCNPELERILALSFALPYDKVLICDPQLQRSLQQLKEQLPPPDQGRERLKEWWNINGQTWVNKLKSLILQYRNIGHQWRFSEQQKDVLQQYYAANQLLVDCLKSGCEVTSTTRQKVEEVLLMPMAEVA